VRGGVTDSNPRNGGAAAARMDMAHTYTATARPASAAAHAPAAEQSVPAASSAVQSLPSSAAAADCGLVTDDARREAETACASVPAPATCATSAAAAVVSVARASASSSAGLASTSPQSALSRADSSVLESVALDSSLLAVLQQACCMPALAAPSALAGVSLPRLCVQRVHKNLKLDMAEHKMILGLLEWSDYDAFCASSHKEDREHEPQPPRPLDSRKHKKTFHIEHACKTHAHVCTNKDNRHGLHSTVGPGSSCGASCPCVCVLCMSRTRACWASWRQ